MKKFLLLPFSALLLLSCISIKRSYAGPGDTTVVQTFTFGSPQDAWFVFPKDTVRFEKILMQYTLKCNPAQTPACGEWDYLTYTYLYDHTGLIDSSVVHQPTFLVNGNVMDTVIYSNIPTWQYSTAWQYNIVHDATTSLNTYTSGTGSIADAKPFKTSDPVARTQYLWKASELSATGMGAGDITGMQFNLASLGSRMNNLSIRIKTTLLDSLTQGTFETTGFTEVYHLNTQLLSTGWNSLQFNTPFSWNGTSNLIIEITFDNPATGTTHSLLSTDVGYHAGLFKSGDDRAVLFHSGAFINAPVNDSLLTLDSVITVSFWAYGNPDLQPQDGSSFEAIDSSSNRVINGHVPWSNNSVYWDAGNSGASYDRIDKAATTQDTEGQWNHWTFIKNAYTDSMKIFLNGNLWHSGSGKTYGFSKMKQFRIGRGNWSGSNSFEGRLDEFAVFKAELEPATIRSYMNKNIDASHPFYNKLFLYYHFDDGNNVTAADAAPIANDDATLIAVDNSLKNSSDLVYGLSQTTIRPNVIFEQGVYTSHMDSVLVQDSTVSIPMQIVMYNDSVNNPGVAVDTMTVWPAGYYHYSYDALGNIVDSVLVASTGSMGLLYYDWYTHFPQVLRYELARYITPYGNGLSLGAGWTWTFDVTDYRTLLADSVHIAAGNWQELLDMRFLMIQGTPSRDVKGIQNLWNGGFNYGFTSDPIESHLTPKTISIPSNVSGARWKSRITGHGMDTPQNCAEFCPKNHYFKVEDSIRFTQLVWRDNCDKNPLYPQGGTWVYDRSNWCPGAEVWTYDFEITPWLIPGGTIKLDHDVQPYTNTSGWDYYQIEDQLVTYGSPNFILDAGIEKVLSPSTDQMWGRMNPVCSRPTIIIKNNGSTPLTSLAITYGINGATQSVYNWTGFLEFEKTATVVLDTFQFITGASKFTVSVGSPNGGADQYAYNNSVTTNFNYVPEFPSKIVVVLRTNNWSAENDYWIKDANGNVVYSRTVTAPNTTYNDTVSLAKGCYEFLLTDTGEDGLQWWANTNQGTGYCRIRNTFNQIIANFNSDFGGEIRMQFGVGLHTGVQDYIYTSETQMKVYPNPSSAEAYIDINLPSRQDGMVSVCDMYGKQVQSWTFADQTAESFTLNSNNLSKGIYFITLRTKDDLITKKLVIQ
ncbi:MAG: peptide-N-glycosidase F-related protein [Bacteroidota bacterium]